uniref:Uncharacterized protein n=1 Tax=Macrostomum lignano TaxID=282301 RepID=A0A1I8HCR3_9PLAT
MSVAFLSAQRSKDPATQVGCCIVNKQPQNCGRWLQRHADRLLGRSVAMATPDTGRSAGLRSICLSATRG